MPRNYQEPAHTWDDAEHARLEPLVREDYDRCHPDDSFDDMKRRVPWPFGYRLPWVPAESSTGAAGCGDEDALPEGRSGIGGRQEQARFAKHWQDRVARMLLDHADDPEFVRVAAWQAAV